MWLNNGYKYTDCEGPIEYEEMTLIGRVSLLSWISFNSFIDLGHIDRYRSR